MAQLLYIHKCYITLQNVCFLSSGYRLQWLQVKVVTG